MPLKQEREFNAAELMEFYKTARLLMPCAGGRVLASTEAPTRSASPRVQDQKLKAFLPLIEDSLVYPVIYDAARTVLSLPPIINGAQSAISLDTRNVFIECTATDLTKAHIVLNMMVTMFSQYTAEPFTVEPVDVVDALGAVAVTPDLSCRQVEADMVYVNRCAGLALSAAEAAQLVRRMALTAEVDAAGTGLRVSVPPTRPDVLHAADVKEDVAIAYGFNNIAKSVPPGRNTR